MPRVKLQAIQAYVMPQMVADLKQLADRWNSTVSWVIQYLIRWGIYALAVEERVQKRDLGISDLAWLDPDLPRRAWTYGPLVPSRSVDEAAKAILDEMERSVAAKREEVL